MKDDVEEGYFTCNRDTFELLGVWEELHNPNFNRVQFNTFKMEAGLQQEKRMQKLREMAVSQLRSLQELNLGMLPKRP